MSWLQLELASWEAGWGAAADGVMEVIPLEVGDLPECALMEEKIAFWEEAIALSTTCQLNLSDQLSQVSQALLTTSAHITRLKYSPSPHPPQELPHLETKIRSLAEQLSRLQTQWHHHQQEVSRLSGQLQKWQMGQG